MKQVHNDREPQRERETEKQKDRVSQRDKKAEMKSLQTNCRALFIAIVALVLFLFFAICSVDDTHDDYAEMKNGEVHDGYEQEIELEFLDI